MPIQLDPSRVRSSSTRSTDRRRISAGDSETIVVPSRASVNFIPTAESLSTLVNSAIAALRKGIHWDRGTILNLLV